MPTDEWQDRRACDGLPDPFVADASMKEHLRGWSICLRCPVKRQCREDTRAKASRGKLAIEGLYAGQMWTREGPMSIAEFHDIKPPKPTRPPDWSEDRRCAIPECAQVFTVTVRNVNKRVCSEACSKQRTRLRDARTRGKANA